MDINHLLVKVYLIKILLLNHLVKCFSAQLCLGYKSAWNMEETPFLK